MKIKTLPNPVYARRINLKTLTNPKIHVTVAGFFRGLPIQQEGTVIKVEQDEMYVSVKDYRVFACTNGQVYLLIDTLELPIHTALQNTTLHEEMLVLKYIEPCQQSWTLRSEERVQVKAPVHIRLHCKKRSFQGVLDNLSACGAGLLVERAYEPILSETGARVLMTFPPTFRLPLKTLLAQVVHYEVLASNLLRVGLRLLPNHKEANLLRAYVNLRKGEILEELAKACQEQTRPWNVVSQYF